MYFWKCIRGHKTRKNYICSREKMEKMDLRKKYLLPFFFFASARQSLPLISINFVSTLMWRAHAFKAFIKFQTQKLIIQQKYNLLSPPSVPQSNPWIHTNTRKHNSSSFPRAPHRASENQKVTGWGMYATCSLCSHPKTKSFSIINTGDNHMKRPGT